MQTVYNSEHAVASAGMLADTSFKFTESMLASEKIPFGRGLMRTPGSSNRVRLPRANYSTLVVSADLIASNSTTVTIGGKETDAVVFATDHATTMAAIVTAIAGLSTVVKAFLDASDNKVIHIITNIPVNDAEADTTDGASQPTWTNTASFIASDFYGIAQETKRLEGSLPGIDNVGEYGVNSMVNVLRRGNIWVYFETAFNPDKDTLYMRYTEGDDDDELIGNFRNDADSGKAVSLAGLPIKVKTFLTGAGYGIIDVNLP